MTRAPRMSARMKALDEVALAYRIPHAAAAVGMSESLMWEMIRQKRIAAIKLVGRRTLIEHAELEAFVARERRPAR